MMPMMRLRFPVGTNSVFHGGGGVSGIIVRTAGSITQLVLSNNNNESFPIPRPCLSSTRGLSNTTISSWSSLRRPLSGPSSGMIQTPLAFSLGTATAPAHVATLSIRGFHSTSLVEFPIRRTRRRSERQSATATSSQDQDDDDDDDTDDHGKGKGPKHAVMDRKEFQKVSRALLDKLYKALQPMQQVNDPFILSRGFDYDISGGGGEYIKIDLGPLQGQYTIQMDPEQCMLIFQSPISGQYDYYCVSNNPEEDGELVWIGAQDGHNFEGLLVRDLIRQCKGLPNL